MIDPHCHSASIAVAVPADVAFAFMADGVKQGDWAFGSWQRRALGDGLFVGTSLITGQPTYVRIHADAGRRLIDYDVGLAADALEPRNSARILPGPVLGLAEDCCVITLMTWRHRRHDDATWMQIGTLHEAEMFVIKGLLERTAA